MVFVLIFLAITSIFTIAWVINDDIKKRKKLKKLEKMIKDKRKPTTITI